MEYVTEMINIAKIQEGFYIGDITAGTNNEVVFTFKISHIINTAGTQVINSFEPMGIKYLTLCWTENINYKLFDSTDSIANKIVHFIDEALSKGEGVLAFSFRGNNRVCVLAIIYLMAKFKWELSKCMEFLQNKKTNVNISKYFMTQLSQFETRLKESSYQSLSNDWLNDCIHDQEEMLIRNTYVNGLMIPKFKNKTQKNTQNKTKGVTVKHIIKWGDKNPLNNKDTLIHPNTCRDLLFQKEVTPVTCHLTKNPVKSAMKNKTVLNGIISDNSNKKNSDDLTIEINKANDDNNTLNDYFNKTNGFQIDASLSIKSNGIGQMIMSNDTLKKSIEVDIPITDQAITNGKMDEVKVVSSIKDNQRINHFNVKKQFIKPPDNNLPQRPSTVDNSLKQYYKVNNNNIHPIKGMKKVNSYHVKNNTQFPVKYDQMLQKNDDDHILSITKITSNYLAGHKRSNSVRNSDETKIVINNFINQSSAPGRNARQLKVNENHGRFRNSNSFRKDLSLIKNQNQSGSISDQHINHNQSHTNALIDSKSFNDNEGSSIKSSNIFLKPTQIKGPIKLRQDYTSPVDQTYINRIKPEKNFNINHYHNIYGALIKKPNIKEYLNNEKLGIRPSTAPQKDKSYIRNKPVRYRKINYNASLLVPALNNTTYPSMKRLPSPMIKSNSLYLSQKNFYDHDFGKGSTMIIKSPFNITPNTPLIK